MARMPFFALLLGMLAVATAPPLILLADVPPFALAAWRLLMVAIVLLPFTAGRLIRDLRQLSGRELTYLIASGVLYGVHFGLFNLAFGHTTKESVVVLLGAQPLMAAAICALWLKESITRKMLAASALAIVGLLIFVWHDDDIYLPHRLSFSVTNFNQEKGFFKANRAWMWEQGHLSGPEQNLFHGGSCWRRELFVETHGYPHISTGYDLEFLGETVREKVLENSGIKLEWEIKRIGRFRPGHEVQEFQGQMI